MALSTFSRFYYDYQITLTSNKINFDEGGGELTATIPLGIYSPTDLAAEIGTQLTSVGGQEYTVVFNRSSRTFSISASSNFSLLVATGTQSSSSAFSVFGFSGLDRSGASAYTGGVSGSEYVTQFRPQDYIAPGFEIEKSDASVNVSANGDVEVVSFGDVQFIEMNLLFITDIAMDGIVIRSNPNGVQDAIDFMTYLINRGPVEFMPDKDNAGVYYKVTLESTPSSSNGVGFSLVEETNNNLPGIYRTGRLRFRITG